MARKRMELFMMRPVKPKALRGLFFIVLSILAVCFLLGLTFPPKPHVILIGWDGVSPELAATMMARGELPNLAALAERGVFSKMLTHSFTQTRLIWPIIYSGVNPDRNGINIDIASAYEKIAISPEMRQVPAIWEYVADSGGWAAVVAPYESYPAETENRVMMVSDVFTRADLAAKQPDDAYSSKQVKDWSEVRLRWALKRPWVNNSLNFLLTPLGFNAKFGSKLSYRPEKAEQLIGVMNTLFIREILAKSELCISFALLDNDLMVVYFEGPDIVQHMYNDITPLNIDTLGNKNVETALRMYDAALGKIMDSAPPGSYFCVVSDHGFDMSPQPQVHFRMVDTSERDKFLTIRDEASNASMNGKILFDSLYIEGDDLVANINQNLTYNEQQSAINYLREKPNIRPVNLGLADDHGSSIDHSVRNKSIAEAVPPVGMFLLSGQAVKNGIRAKTITIYDIAPTLLYALDLDVPSEMDGDVKKCQFKPNWLAKHPIKLIAKIPQRNKTAKVTIKDNSDRVLELQGLGYLDGK